MKSTRWIEINQLQSTDMTFYLTFEPIEESACFLRGLLECWQRRKMETLVTFLTWGCMLLQRVAMVAKKLPVGGKITACVQQICLWVVIEKHCLMKHFAFLKTVCYQYLNFVLQVTYCFLTSFWLPTTNFLGMYLISCNLISQFCWSGPSGPSYSSRTVIPSPLKVYIISP